MALKFEELQSKVCDILKTIEPFKSYQFASGDTLANHILADDGTVREAMEEALKGTGWCVVIAPPMLITTTSQVSAKAESKDNNGVAKFTALTVVSLRTNPKVNTGPTSTLPNRTVKVEIISTCGNIMKGFLSWHPGSGEHGFTLPVERPCEPDFEDIGALTYDIRILKSVCI